MTLFSAQPLKSRGGQYYRVHSAFVRGFRHSRFHIAAYGFDAEVRPCRHEQCAPSHAAGAHCGPVRESGQPTVVAAYQHVPRVAPFKDRSQVKARRQFGGHVLERVCRHIDVAAFEFLFDLLDEDPDPKLGNGGGAVPVAASAHDHGLELSPGIGAFQGRNCKRSLGQREPAAARAHANGLIRSCLHVPTWLGVRAPSSEHS